jgi:hypothetical protein
MSERYPSNRQQLHRTVTLIRRDLHRAEDLCRVIGINDPTPPEVAQALRVLECWTEQLLRGGKRP